MKSHYTIFQNMCEEGLQLVLLILQWALKQNYEEEDDGWVNILTEQMYLGGNHAAMSIQKKVEEGIDTVYPFFYLQGMCLNYLKWWGLSHEGQI